MCIAANLCQPPIAERWLIHRDILCETARVALTERLVLAGASGEGGSLTLASTARAVWFSEVRLARALLARSELARNRVSSLGTGVQVLDHVAFFQVIETDKRQSFSQRIVAAGEDLGLQRGVQQPKKKPNAFSALHRMSRLWSPYDKRLVLAGIQRVSRDGSFSVMITPSLEVDALRKGWAPTFACKPTDTALAQGILSQHSAKWNFADVSPPGLDDVACAFKRVKHSAPGLDGLQYCAWASAGTFGIQTLYPVMLHLMSGLMMLVRCNSSLVVFAPKGEEPNEPSIVREPCNTRPLSLKSCDNKVTLAVVNFTLCTPFATHARPVQRGFTPGRQLVSNVVVWTFMYMDEDMGCNLLIATLR